MVNRKLQPVLAFIVVVIFFVQGCAGRAARPIKVTQSGDVKKTCNEIRHETKKYRRNLKKMIPAIKSADKKRTSPYDIRGAIDYSVVFFRFD